MRKTSLLILLILLLGVPAFGQGLVDLTAQNVRVHALDGNLDLDKSQVDAGASADAVRAFLRLEKRDAATVDSLVKVDQYALPNNTIEQIVLKQQVAGLDVYGAYVKASFDENGSLVHLIDATVVPSKLGVFPARITTDQALAAATDLYYPMEKIAIVRTGTDGVTDTFAQGSYFYTAPTVKRVAVALDNGEMEEGFLVQTWTKQSNLLHHTVVGAQGQILNVELRTNNDSYNIFPNEPTKTPQEIVAGPGSGNAESPIGWLFSGDHRDIHIQGNNVEAYLDEDTNDSADPGGNTISDGNFVATADLTLDPTQAPNQAVAVQNLFFVNNVIHDKLYRHGFVEATKNFQDDNFGLGGAGGDAVHAEAQDGSGLNNANFSTPSDGSPGRMQMFIWDKSDPRRDGDVDSDIIWHEYGHGLTWRMIGSMSGAMSGAIGEGNSDVLALYTNLDDVVAEYSYNNPIGIRSEPYTNYSRTYGDFTGDSVHFDGEIYAAAMWRLLELYQANGIALDTLWDDMIGGMNFTPSGPAMEDMRDGILAQADSARDCLVWEAFAAFGIGEGAQGDVKGGGPFGGGKVSITESFAVPTECQ